MMKFFKTKYGRTYWHRDLSGLLGGFTLNTRCFQFHLGHNGMDLRMGWRSFLVRGFDE